MDHNHFFLNAHIQRNHQRFCWWTEFTQRPAEQWRVDVSDEEEGPDRSFEVFCTLRGISASSLSDLDDVRASFARQLLVLEEKQIDRLVKIARKTKEGTDASKRAWLNWDTYCRRYELYTCKRVLRWLSGNAGPDDAHCQKLERQFQADLKARFAGGVARQHARNKMLVNGTITDSIFDGRARKAAEAAVCDDLTRQQAASLERRAQADAERHAEDLRHFEQTEGDGEARSSRAQEDICDEARRVL